MPAPAAAAASALTGRRIALYGAASSGAAAAVVVAALHQRPNFYSAAVLLARSNGCMLVLLNWAVFLTLLFGKACQKAFFGPLRAVEIEHLYERSWYAVTESLIAMTIFRDSFDAWFILMFGTLLFLKVFHWLSSDRVEWMEQAPTIPLSFHVRMNCLFWTLLCVDVSLVIFAIEVILLQRERVGVMIIFASEFMILTAQLLSTMAKYAINTYDVRQQEPWEAKSMWIFAVDVVTDFLKLTTYLTFFFLILTYYGFPLNMVRDVFFTARSFLSRIQHFFRYRAATRNMERRFPDATAQELHSGDGTCIICREEMVARGAADAAPRDAAPEAPAAPAPAGPNETPKKLPCGHIFHFHCLRSWLERQQSCPTCRRTVFDQAPPPRAAAPPPAPQPAAAPAAPPAGDNLADQRPFRDFLRDYANHRRPPGQAAPAAAQAAGQTGAAQGPAAPLHDARAGIFDARSDRDLPADLRRVVTSLLTDAEQSALAGPQGPKVWQLPSTHGPDMRRAPPPPWTFGATPRPATAASERPGATELPRDAESTHAPEQDSAQGDSSDPLDAREAARRAALRRFGLESDAGPSRASPFAGPSSSTVPSAPHASTSSAPHLVPLFDPSLVPAFADEHQARLPYPLRAPTSSAMDGPLGVGLAANGHLAGPSGGVQLLDELSPEQLRELSRGTRRGLEERLRLLGRVQGTLWTAVDELTRALSVMPEEDEADDQAAAGDGAPGSDAAAPAQGKGKAPAADVIAPTAADADTRAEEADGHL